MKHVAARGEHHGWKQHPDRVARGERSSHAKLTEADVLAIRSLEGRMTQQALAEMFGVSIGTINPILRRKTWTHLP